MPVSRGQGGGYDLWPISLPFFSHATHFATGLSSDIAFVVHGPCQAIDGYKTVSYKYDTYFPEGAQANIHAFPLQPIMYF